MHNFPSIKIPQQDISVQEKSIRINSNVLNDLKYGVWIYFLLLIFEGALRKWVLPGLATPLLIVRDPIAAWILFRAIQSGIFKINTPVLIAWVVMFISFFTTLLFGHGHVGVAIYGLRIFLLHFPLIFIFGKIMDKDDVIKIGKVFLYIHIGMTILVAIQFFSPQSAWVNRGIGGDETGSGFGATADFFRVPGTFSFTNGLAYFYGFVVTFLFYFFIKKDDRIPYWLLIVSTLAYLAAIPLSVSRTVFFQTVVTFVFTIIVVSRNSQSLIRIFFSILVFIVLFEALSNFDFFKVASGAFTERFEGANRNEGGVEGVFFDRFLGGMIGALSNDLNSSFFGKGLGMGTNAGAKLLVGDNNSFLVSEGEWGRLIGEMGVLLGFIVILLRVIFVGGLVFKTWKTLSSQNYLPWLICSFSSVIILQGAWAQPTTLGFAILSGGLVLSSMNEPFKT